jgi:Tfp pilus assembly protein PilF
LAWYLLGRATLDANLARAAYLRAAEIAPRYGRAHMGLASVHRARGELEQAERAYRLALKLDPNLPEAWIGLGAVCIAQGRPDEAVKVAEAAIKAVPGDPEAYLALAELRPERAVEILTQASQKVTTDPRVYASLAQELMRDGRFAEARAHVERAVILVPASPQVNLLAMQVKELESGALTWAGAERLARARALANETPVAALVELDELAKEFPKLRLGRLGPRTRQERAWGSRRGRGRLGPGLTPRAGLPRRPGRHGALVVGS